MPKTHCGVLRDFEAKVFAFKVFWVWSSLKWNLNIFFQLCLELNGIYFYKNIFTKQESIPVGCVSSIFLVGGGYTPPRDNTPEGQHPLRKHSMRTTPPRTIPSKDNILQGQHPLQRQHPPKDHTPCKNNLRKTPPKDNNPSPLWTEWLTDRCKNITLPQTSFANGNKKAVFEFRLDV